jgi:hypothetical protein
MELEYEIDNRDSKTTWLHIQTAEGTVFGHIELRLQDMFDLIENLIDNLEG